MPYGPGTSFRGGDYEASAGQQALSFMQRNKEQEQERKEKDKADADLMKGFKALHSASPELQEMFPIEDFGDMSANAVRGIMGGLKTIQAQQQMAQQAQQQQFQQQFQQEGRGIQQQQFEQEMGADAAMLGFRRQQQAENTGMKMLQFQREPQMIDADGDGAADFMMDPNQNMHRMPTQQATRTIDADADGEPDFYVDETGRHHRIPKASMNQWDYIASRRGVPPSAAPGGRVNAPASNKNSSNAQGGMVLMESPEGARRMVPAGKVEELKRKGARVVQ